MLMQYNMYRDPAEHINRSLIDSGIDATAQAMAACAYVRCLEDSNIPSTACQREDARQWATAELKRLRDISGMVARMVAQHVGGVDAQTVTVDFVSGAVIFYGGVDAETITDKLRRDTTTALNHSIDRELDIAEAYGIEPPAEVDAAEVAAMKQIEEECEPLDAQLEQLAADGDEALGKIRRGVGKEISDRLIALNEKHSELDRVARSKRRRWMYERYCQEVRE